MKPPNPHWVRCESEEELRIPSPDGNSVAKKVKVNVPAWRDPANGEIYLDGESIRILDDMKARHLGILTTTEIKALRERLGKTQKELSRLLRIGEKTWTRWESGRERPLKSFNVLLCALRDGRIDTKYLEWLADGQAGKKNTPENSAESSPAPIHE